MIRHAGLGPPQPIIALAHPMQSSACVRPLMTSIRRAELLPPGSPSAYWTAVALPTIATAAETLWRNATIPWNPLTCSSSKR